MKYARINILIVVCDNKMVEIGMIRVINISTITYY